MIIRDTLVANRTYYVRTDGSDSNSGLANDASSAFLTIQKAINVVCDTIDNMGHIVTIQVADGNYNAPITLKPYIGSGLVVISGNPNTPSNVSITISTTGTNCINASYVPSQWHITGFKLSTTGTAGDCISVMGSVVTFAAMDFGVCAQIHIHGIANSILSATGDYIISGGASQHFAAQESSSLNFSGITIGLTGTPAFGTFFANANLCGIIWVQGTIFSGSATGPRYVVGQNGVINTGTAGANYLPGSLAGSVFTGGQYT